MLWEIMAIVDSSYCEESFAGELITACVLSKKPFGLVTLVIDLQRCAGFGFVV